MNYLPWILLVLVSLAWLGTSYYNSHNTASEMDETVHPVLSDDPWAIFEEAELMEKLKASGRPYLPFLDKSTLSCGIYRLETGATDGQQPHKMDEIYYTLSGKAKFEVEGEQMDVKAGTILFVEAEAEHKFYDISEDLELLVFFSKAEAEDK